MKAEYVYRICKIRMSKKAMSDLLYASIITRSGLPSSLGIGIYQYSRSQNAYNHVDFMVHIHPDKIREFEDIAGVELVESPKIIFN